MEETLHVKGEVHFEFRYADGRVERDVFRNLVVTNGRQRLAKLLGGDETDTVAFYRIGTGTSAVTASDTALQTQVNVSVGNAQKAIDSATYPAANKVQFDFTIDNDEANGNNLSEFALYTSDAVMFARVVRTPFAKTNAVAITGHWIITF